MTNKFRVVEVGDGGSFLVPIPRAIMQSLGWKDGDEIRVEPVVTRAGKVDYLVVEKP